MGSPEVSNKSRDWKKYLGTLHRGFCCEPPAGEEGVRKVKQISETKACSWLLVGTLVEEVGVERGSVLGVKALPKQLITFPLGYGSEEEQVVA